MLERINSDDGWMGPTHAMSAVAITFLLTMLAGEFMFKEVFGTTDWVVFVAATIIVVGASLMPDLDATTSTSINVLGIIGTFLSTVMRGFSKTVQSIFRTKYDKADPDPHRGFWHTILAAILAGGLVLFLVSIKIPIAQIGKTNLTTSNLVVMFIIFISIQLLIASLIKPLYKKTKDSFIAKVIITVLSIIIAVSLTLLSPPGLDFKWVAAAVTLGWLCHLVGDMMTVSGVPVLAPFIKIKGKRWWMFSLSSSKAGGWLEMSVFNPLFVIIIIVASIKIIPMLT